MINEGIVNVSYIIATILFILALGGLSNQEKAKRAITIGDLLSMRSGLETTSNRYYGGWVMSPNWVRHVLSRPLEQRPGGRMRYSTGNTHLLSAALRAGTGMSPRRWAEQRLFDAMGIDVQGWQRDPNGLEIGGNNLSLRPRDALKIGLLYLDGGRWEAGDL